MCPFFVTSAQARVSLRRKNREGEFPLPQNLFAGEDLYALRVEGDSMCEAGIDDGDYVIVRRQSSVDIGEK